MIRRRRRQLLGGQVELNVIPLIDVVFFLLVFYVISTAFVQEQALPLNRPASTRATAVSEGFVPVALTRSGAIHVGGRVVELAAVANAVSDALRAVPSGKVVVIADRAVPTGVLLSCMDACSLGGASSVDVAATRSATP